MRPNLIFAISFLAASVALAQNDNCSWGDNPPSRFRCDGENFVFGTATCDAHGMLHRIFCKSEFASSGIACSADNDPKTVACYEQLIERPQATVAVVSKKDPAGCGGRSSEPRLFMCTNGKVYFAHQGGCSNKIGWRTRSFCREQFRNDPAQCENDFSKETVNCMREYEISIKDVYENNLSEGSRQNSRSAR